MSSSSQAMVKVSKTQPTLADLDRGVVKAPVTVRVLRKWYVYPRGGGPKPVSVELVFADTEGTTIQGHIDFKHIYLHDQQLHEDHAYHISKFSVVTNTGKYRATRNNYSINLGVYTIVRPAARRDIVPMPEYVFTPPEECFDTGFNRNYLVDISGLLVGVGDEVTFPRPSGESTRMKIDLENRGYKFQVTLLQPYVQQLNEFRQSGDHPNTVLVLLWCKVDDWTGGISLQTTMGSTKMLINPDLPEANALRESASQTSLTPTLTVSQVSKSSGISDDLLMVEERHYLAQVIDDVHVSNFVVLATIDGINLEFGWYYPACATCKSFKKVTADEDLYYCDRCRIHVKRVTKKYLLKLALVDATDTIEVVLFDNNVRALIDRPADQVYDTWNEDPEKAYLPTELTGLIGKEVLIKIGAEGQIGDRFGRQYKARNISDNRDLIARYLSKWAVDEAPLASLAEVLLIENTPTTDSQSVHQKEAGVSQDLITKFDNEESSAKSVNKGKTCVDLSKDSDETPPTKRKSPDDKLPTIAAIPVKAIKIEK